MTDFINRLLGRNKEHSDIMDKNQEVILGTDKKSQQVHNMKNQYTKELLKISSQAKKVGKEAEKLTVMIDTAYMIAKSTGNMR